MSTLSKSSKNHARVVNTCAISLLLTTSICVADTGTSSANAFNPSISLILDGRYSDYQDEYALPGFQTAGEAGLPDKGIALGHSELTASANVDQVFMGYLNTAIAMEGSETAVELEEAYLQTLGLGEGLTIKGGRFYSGLGYLNSVHDHAHDFTDVPLVYAGLFGNHLLDSGMQLRWLAPTDIYLELGAELLRGDGFPGGANEVSNKGRTLFVKTGDDYSDSISWQAGLSHYSSSFDVREAGGHSHGGGQPAADNELLDGDVNVTGIDAVIKWAPHGNPTQRNLKIQFEYFVRNEKGVAEFTESDQTVSSDYDGKQTGYYIQAVYQWRPQWRTGLRYDRLHANNKLTNFNPDADGDTTAGVPLDEFLDESGLGAGDDPTRISAMVDWSASEFSRLRLQFNRNDNGIAADNQVYFQYLMSLGAHGAHQF